MTRRGPQARCGEWPCHFANDETVQPANARCLPTCGTLCFGHGPNALPRRPQRLARWCAIAGRLGVRWSQRTSGLGRIQTQQSGSTRMAPPYAPPNEVAAGPETTRRGDDQLGSSHSTGLVPSASVRQKPCTKSMVFRTANGLRSEDPRMLSLRLPPRPRVSINTPGIAFRALATSGLPNPVVSALSAVHKLRVICSEGSRGV